MTNSETLKEQLDDIGDAIRTKTGGSSKLTLSQMPGEILSIEGSNSDDDVVPLRITFIQKDIIKKFDPRLT